MVIWSTKYDAQVRLLGHVAQKKARDQAFVQRMKNRHFIRMGIKGNVVNVKHYRDQVFGNRPAF